MVHPKQDEPANLAGKVLLITGGTSGLGAASAIALARLGPAKIYICGRRAKAADAVIQQIYEEQDHTQPFLDNDNTTETEKTPTSPPSQQETTKPPAKRIPEVTFLHCDLADLSSVQNAARHLLKRETKLDLLMANAGVAAVAPGRTRDGYEMHFGTNHVGHALLIRMLLPLLQAAANPNKNKNACGGRVVTVTSFAFKAASWWGGIPLERMKVVASSSSSPKTKPKSKIETETEIEIKQGKTETTTTTTTKTESDSQSEWLTLWRWKRYAESKLANVAYAKELARRYPAVTSVSVSPGFVETEMVAGMRFCDRLGTRAMGFLAGGMVTPEEGALNQVWAATAEREELINGAVYDPVGTVSRSTTDAKLGERLWEWTEREIADWL